MSEYVPDPWPMVLLVLAAWRVWKLVGDDRILDRPRDWILRKLRNPDGRPFRRGGEIRRAYWSDFLLCPYCAGAWVSLAWWGAWMMWPEETLIVAVPFAISASVGLLGTIWAKLSD